MKPQTELWVTNISNRNVSLRDLNLTIKAYSSVNLLDKKHYHYTLEQVLSSISSGSIHVKSDKIVVRKYAPEITRINMPYLEDTSIPSRERSILSTKEEKYEELSITDEQFAEENAEIADIDSKPIFVKGK